MAISELGIEVISEKQSNLKIKTYKSKEVSLLWTLQQQN